MTLLIHACPRLETALHSLWAFISPWIALPLRHIVPVVWAALTGACCVQVWQEVAGQIYFAALTFQIIMLGLFLIKGAPVQTLLTVPLPILTVLLWRSSDVLFRPPQQRLSLEAAADLDERDRVCLFSPNSRCSCHS